MRILSTAFIESQAGYSAKREINITR